MDKKIHNHSEDCGTSSAHTLRNGVRRKKQQKRTCQENHYNNHNRKTWLLLARSYHDLVLLDSNREHAFLQDPIRKSGRLRSSDARNQKAPQLRQRRRMGGSEQRINCDPQRPQHHRLAHPREFRFMEATGRR